MGWWRVFALACIAAAGVVTIVGSGGGSAAPECSFFSDSCNPTFDPLPPIPYATVGPQLVAVQVGGTASFAVESNVDQPTYVWCRQPVGASECTQIPGATGASYTLSGASLGDDGTTLRVTVTGTNGTAWALGRVAVSSMPGVTFEDGEFLDDDWAVTSFVVPSQDGPSASLARAVDGGNPGAFRTATYQLPVLPSSVRVFYSALPALYDPASQGAIYVIDFGEDCIHGDISNLLSYTGPMLEQAGRRFVATKWVMYCKATDWTAVRRSSLAAEDFELVDGPACPAGEACPDFSGSGAPIRLGLVGGTELSSGLVPPVQTSHGFDNWKATVWRR